MLGNRGISWCSGWGITVIAMAIAASGCGGDGNGNGNGTIDVAMPFPNASKIVLTQDGNTILALYSAANNGPMVAAINLNTAKITTKTLTNVTEVYDLVVLGAGRAALNYLSAAGYGVRFLDPGTLETDGADVVYQPAGTPGTPLPGRLCPHPQAQTLFATHSVRQGASITASKLFAISVSGRALIDADDDDANGVESFDTGLVDDAMHEAFNCAFDPATSEILVGNRSTEPFVGQPFVTAIDWTAWGTWDRDAGLTAPTDGVRLVDMNPGVTMPGVQYWSFVDGIGIGAHPSTPVVSYESGEEALTTFRRDLEVDLRSPDLYLQIVPQRQSFFAAVYKPNSGLTGIEEWSLTTLERLHRYNGQFLEDPEPRAFVVDASAEKLYVAFTDSTGLDVLDLCSGAECVAP